MDEEVEKIRRILLDFEWDSYGMDFVNECQDEWAEDLAERIANA